MSSFNNSMNGNVAGTSFAEQLIYLSLAVYFYNTYKVALHYKLDGMEYDIAIPELNTVIEVQSILHVSKTHQKNDKLKQNYCKANNIKLITIMVWKDSSKVQINYQTDYIEVGCRGLHIRDSIEKVLLPDNKLDFNKIKLQKNEHSRCIAAIYRLLTLITNQKVDIEQFCNLHWTKIWQTSINNSIDATLSFENSLESKDNLVKEYRGLVKYGYIDPREISLGSNELANWECISCNYKWQARIVDRALSNNRCPKCSAKAQSTCTDTSKSFFVKCKSLVPFIKANSMQEKEAIAKKIYISSHKQLELFCPHCNTLKCIIPNKLQGATNVRCSKCKRLFIE